MKTITNFFKSHWLELLLLIAALLVAFFLLKGCGKDNVLKTTTASVDKALDNHNDSSAILQKKYDSVVNLNYQQQFTILMLRAHSDSVDRELLAPAEELRERAGNIAATIDRGAEFRQKKDTPKIVMNCDTAFKEILEIQSVATRYKTIADSAIAIHQEIDRARDFADSLKDQLVVDLIAQKNLDTHTIDTLSTNFSILKKDDKKKTIELNLFKPAGIAGGIGAAYLALKFIIIPLIKK